jgi:hypothetical protein
MEARAGRNPARGFCMSVPLALSRQDGHALDAAPHHGRDEPCGNPAYCEMLLFEGVQEGRIYGTSAVTFRGTYASANLDRQIV